MIQLIISVGFLAVKAGFILKVQEVVRNEFTRKFTV
ncbi:MAG: hypothetical protein H6Q73_826 [Firmicutes bacterium]|nr:hypothetical protein [Bacillota bacterium]